MTRSCVKDRSNCARAPKTWNRNSPCGVVVSICSVSDRKAIPRSLRSFTVLSRCGSDRPRRSSFHTTKQSPGRRNANLPVALGGDPHVADQHVRKTPLERFPHSTPFRQGLSRRILSRLDRSTGPWAARRELPPSTGCKDPQGDFWPISAAWPRCRSRSVWLCYKNGPFVSSGHFAAMHSNILRCPFGPLFSGSRWSAANAVDVRDHRARGGCALLLSANRGARRPTRGA